MDTTGPCLLVVQQPTLTEVQQGSQEQQTRATPNAHTLKPLFCIMFINVSLAKPSQAAKPRVSVGVVVGVHSEKGIMGTFLRKYNIVGFFF